MTIKLHRYYGDDRITKSVMEVWLDGDSEPRMVCEARESSFKDYEEAFAGASPGGQMADESRWRRILANGTEGAEVSGAQAGVVGAFLVSPMQGGGNPDW